MKYYKNIWIVMKCILFQNTKIVTDRKFFQECQEVIKDGKISFEISVADGTIISFKNGSYIKLFVDKEDYEQRIKYYRVDDGDKIYK